MYVVIKSTNFLKAKDKRDKKYNFGQRLVVTKFEFYLFIKTHLQSIPFSRFIAREQVTSSQSTPLIMSHMMLFHGDGVKMLYFTDRVY